MKVQAKPPPLDIQITNRKLPYVLREFQFDAGHRIQNHESKCRNLHGHRYKIILCLRDSKVDSNYRIMDFGTMKTVWGAWFDRHLDHGMILQYSDHEARDAMTCIPDQKIYLMENPPTAEALAMHLLYDIAPLVMKEYTSEVCEVFVYETPNCFAYAELDD